MFECHIIRIGFGLLGLFHSLLKLLSHCLMIVFIVGFSAHGKDSGTVIVTSGMGFVRRPGFDEHTGMNINMLSKINDC